LDLLDYVKKSSSNCLSDSLYLGNSISRGRRGRSAESAKRAGRANIKIVEIKRKKNKF
jgi:hypothetical protein